MSKSLKRVVEVGCSSGALARAYIAENPGCEYTGIEIDAEYAEQAKTFCSSVICANVETMSESTFLSLFPSDCGYSVTLWNTCSIPGLCSSACAATCKQTLESSPAFPMRSIGAFRPGSTAAPSDTKIRASWIALTCAGSRGSRSSSCSNRPGIRSSKGFRGLPTNPKDRTCFHPFGRWRWRPGRILSLPKTTRSPFNMLSKLLRPD